MNDKQSLYTKYRPSNFNEVVGQRVAKDILLNSIIKNKINHAYLFYGIRGTGKTTLARIFAKAINCKSLEKGNPCDKCNSCKEIKSGSSFDVIEIDAASNNGVDEIRTIKENTNYLTTSSSYKVYIIDEVHMLTKAAFNALLKTLEEPPKNTIFLLATTEIQKIPKTVLSRTIIINLEVMSEEDIKEGLEVIVKGENISFEEEAIQYLVLVSGGSLRDAISNMETSLLYNEELTVKNVLKSLGIINKESIKDMLLNNPRKLVDQIDSSEIDIKKLIVIVLEVLIDIVKKGNNKFINLLNELLISTCNIKDPFLLKVAFKTSLLNVSHETLIGNKPNNNLEDNALKETIIKKESGVPRETILQEDKVEVDNTKTKSLHKDTVDTINDSSNKEEDVPRETVINNNTPNNEDESLHKELKIITEFVTANNYIYTMIKTDSLELERIKGKWRYIDNYITSIDYKEVVSSLLRTKPLAYYGKTIIVGFSTKQQANEFKRLSLTPSLFKFIKEILGEYKFILPIIPEQWSKLINVKNSGYKLTSANTEVSLDFNTYVNSDVKKEKIDKFFGKENVNYE